jgi:sn-glycerol 3-phosphate transport system substrate-binding protein
MKSAVAVMAIAATVAFAGCSSSGGSSTSATGVPSAGALDSASGVTTVTFWHSMTGTNGTVLQTLIDKFNQENQGKINVVGTFQGAYDAAMQKYQAAMQSKTTPTMMQVYDIGSRFMMDSGAAIPIQGFIDRDKYDTSDLQPAIASYYTVNGQLWSMPFNSSMPVLYYNKTLFEQAGLPLPPSDSAMSLADVKTDAEALSKVNGGPADTGFLAAIYGWFTEEEMAVNGDMYCTPDNGRGSASASAFNFDSDSSVQFMQWWADLVKSGVAGNTGAVTADAQNAFKTGTVGMNLESTGVLGSYEQAAQANGFEVGVAFYPSITPTPGNGPVIGGASLWISSANSTDAEKDAAWKFIQFLSAPEQQAAWHIGTGYFPISKGALNQPNDVAYRQANPAFDVAVTQLEQTKVSTANQGCSSGVMVQARKAAETAITASFQGSDPKTELTNGVNGLVSQIQAYNQSVGH